jgi:hypothetical protein
MSGVGAKRPTVLSGWGDQRAGVAFDTVACPQNLLTPRKLAELRG